MSAGYLGSHGGTSEPVTGFAVSVYESDVDDISEEIVEEIGSTPSGAAYTSVKFVMVSDGEGYETSYYITPDDWGGVLVVADDCELGGSLAFSEKETVSPGSWVDISVQDTAAGVHISTASGEVTLWEGGATRLTITDDGLAYHVWTIIGTEPF